MKLKGYQILCIVLLLYTMIAGFLVDVPKLPILHESIRNLYFHVPMWFGMIILLLISMIYSIRHLRTSDLSLDIKASAFAHTGVLFGVLGLVTGMIWANYTWGEPWSNDPKQNASAIGMLLYVAYFILRSSFNDNAIKGRISAVYNITAYMALIPLLFILPRLTDSLHPGNGGNPGFGNYDLDNNMRLVFYPAVIGWTLLGVWLANLKSSLLHIKLKLMQIGS